jgi:uncharacterized protein (TIRG00374 family)
MLGVVRHAHQTYLVAACVACSVTYILRGLRWRVILSAAARVSPATAFWASMVGYLGNNFLPARAGEVLRSVLLSRRVGISVSYVFATALTERIGDLVAVAMMSLLAIVTLAATPSWLRLGATAIAIPGTVSLIALVALPRLTVPITGLVARLPLSERPALWLNTSLDRFLLGLTALQHVNRALSFLGLTGVIWIIDAMTALVIGHAFEITLTLPIALLLLAALGIASAIPSTPGSIGVLQFVAVTTLGPFGLSPSEAIVYIIGFQAVNIVVVVVWGLVGLWQLGKTKTGALYVGGDPGLSS